MATDSVSKNFSVARVTIHLRDINDHRPTFPHSLYNLSVFEHSANGSVVTDSVHVSDDREGGTGLEMPREGQTGDCGPAQVSVSSNAFGSQQACMHV